VFLANSLLERAARLADVAKIETQSQYPALRQLLAEKNQLLAILMRLHAVAENRGAGRIVSRGMMQHADQRVTARVGK